MLKAFCIGLSLTAGAAAAQDSCLTARDLSRGIEMRFSEGDVFSVSRGRDGNLVLVENYSDGSASIQYVGAYALYIEREVELSNGRPDAATEIRIDFGQPSITLPKPEAGGNFTVQTTNLFADGTERAEVYEANFGAMSQMTFGNCTYDMLPVRLRYSWPGESDGMNLEYTYFPDLGAAFLASSQFDGEERLSLNPIALDRRQK